LKKKSFVTLNCLFLRHSNAQRDIMQEFEVKLSEKSGEWILSLFFRTSQSFILAAGKNNF
jgi:hypothetical protein